MPKKREKRVETSLDEEMKEVLPAEGEIFGVVEEVLGKARLRVRCQDGKTRVCRIRGKLRGRRHWMKPGDLVLVSIWDFQPDKGDVTVKYNRAQTEWLIKNKYITREWLEEEEIL